MNNTPAMNWAKSAAILLVAAVLIFSVLAVKFVINAPAGSRISFANPGKISLAAGPIRTMADAQLANAGWQCEYVDRFDGVSGFAFIRREFHTARIKITGGNEKISPPKLYYKLLDANAQELSDGPLLAGSSTLSDNFYEIADSNLVRTQCILVTTK